MELLPRLESGEKNIVGAITYFQEKEKENILILSNIETFSIETLKNFETF